jgi:broad specificity phosphatase PhoE
MWLGAEVFHRRIEELRKHILERPEQCIAVVTHSGVLEALTGGVLFRNGEIRTLTAGELIARTGTQA